MCFKDYFLNIYFGQLKNMNKILLFCTFAAITLKMFLLSLLVRFPDTSSETGVVVRLFIYSNCKKNYEKIYL